MSYQLIRISYEATGVYGKLIDSNGQFVCHTIEYAFPNGSTFESKLPNGSYKCVLNPIRLSFGDPYQTYVIQGIPNNAGIFFKAGSSPVNGVVGLGQERIGDQLINPQKAFEDFVGPLLPVFVFHLTVSRQV